MTIEFIRGIRRNYGDSVVELRKATENLTLLFSPQKYVLLTHAKGKGWEDSFSVLS